MGWKIAAAVACVLLVGVIGVWWFSLYPSPPGNSQASFTQPSYMLGLSTVTPSSALMTNTEAVTYSSYAVAGETVNEMGVLHRAGVSPVCSIASPCQKKEVQLFYLATDNGSLYQLIFVAGNPVSTIANGTRVEVTGVLTYPSAWQGESWAPVYVFSGDIHVQAIRTL